MSRKDLFDDFPESHPTQFPIYLALLKHTPFPAWIEEQKLVITEIEQLPSNLIIVRIERP